MAAGSDKKIAGARLILILCMIIFGSIGIMVRYINMPSSVIALFRSSIGAALLIVIMLIKRENIDKQAMKDGLLWLIVSGIAMAFNWILLFEAYNYTSIATATMCYYFAPIIVIYVSPVILREKLSKRDIICVLVAIVGMLSVSGFLNGGISSISELIGVFMGLGAAVLYAFIILTNKKIPSMPALQKTTIQLISAAVVMLLYSLIRGHFDGIDLMAASSMPGFMWEGGVLALLLIVGLFHTGMAYALYFYSLRYIPAGSVAIMSYIDPVVAVILSALLLAEIPDIWTVAGAVMIIGAAIVNELPSAAADR